MSSVYELEAVRGGAGHAGPNVAQSAIGRAAAEGVWLPTALFSDALGVAQRLIWSGRLAEQVLERTAIACGLRRRGDYEVLALLRRAEPELSPLSR